MSTIVTDPASWDCCERDWNSVMMIFTYTLNQIVSFTSHEAL